jgi:hypothetical protein
MIMTNAHKFTRLTGCALAAIVLFAAITMRAQTIISNETLVTSTFVVNKTPVKISCLVAGCSVKAPVLSSIPVTCPAAIGATCTFHIALNTTVTIALPCGGEDCLGTSGPSNTYQFLVDGSAPLPGPTDAQGHYIFSANIETDTLFPSVAQYPAAVIATVTNSNSQDHVIDLSVGCVDKEKNFGCGLTVNRSSMRVDVFEP